MAYGNVLGQAMAAMHPPNVGTPPHPPQPLGQPLPPQSLAPRRRRKSRKRFKKC